MKADSVLIGIMGFRCAKELSNSIRSVQIYEPNRDLVVCIDRSPILEENLQQVDMCFSMGVPWTLSAETLLQPRAFNSLMQIGTALGYQWVYTKHMDSIFTGPVIDDLLFEARAWSERGVRVGAVNPPVPNCHELGVSEADWWGMTGRMDPSYSPRGFQHCPPGTKSGIIAECSGWHCEALISTEAFLDVGPLSPGCYYFDEAFDRRLHLRGSQVWASIAVRTNPVLHLGGRTFAGSVVTDPLDGWNNKEKFLEAEGNYELGIERMRSLGWLELS